MFTRLYVFLVLLLRSCMHMQQRFLHSLIAWFISYKLLVLRAYIFHMDHQHISITYFGLVHIYRLFSFFFIFLFYVSSKTSTWHSKHIICAHFGTKKDFKRTFKALCARLLLRTRARFAAQKGGKKQIIIGAWHIGGNIFAFTSNDDDNRYRHQWR